MNRIVSFRRMEDGTKADYELLDRAEREYAKGDTLGGTGVVYLVERAGTEGPVADKRRKLEVSVNNDLPSEETMQPLASQ